MNTQAAPVEFQCEVSRVESLDDGSRVPTSLVNPAYPRSVRFASAAEALEAASRDASGRASGTDYDVWPNGWNSGETAVRYRFLPNGKQVDA